MTTSPARAYSDLFGYADSGRQSATLKRPQRGALDYALSCSCAGRRWRGVAVHPHSLRALCVTRYPYRRLARPLSATRLCISFSREHRFDENQWKAPSRALHQPEFELSDDTRAYVARGDSNARFPMEAVLRGLEDSERHSNSMQVVVLVGTPRCSERVQQNKACSP